MVYRVAVVQVSESLKGKADKKLIRVAFRMPKNVEQPGNPAVQPVPQPAIQPFPIKKGPFQPNFDVQMTVGMEGLFYLQKNAAGNCYTLVQSFGAFVSAENNNSNYEVEVAQIRVTANPMNSLKAAKAADRATAAVLLVKQYRQPVFVPGKGQVQEPINAEESKLILKGLLEADWPVAPQPLDYQKHPAIAFNMLGLTPHDGFQAQNQGVYTPAFRDAAKAWLEKNWKTYRIKRYVGGNGAVGGPVNGPIDLPVQPIGGPIQIVPPAPPIQGGAGAGQGGAGVAGPGGIIQIQPLPAPGKALPPVPPQN